MESKHWMKLKALEELYVDQYLYLSVIGWIAYVVLFFSILIHFILSPSSTTVTEFLSTIALGFIWWLRPQRGGRL